MSKKLSSHIKQGVSSCWSPDGQDRRSAAAEEEGRRRSDVEQRSVDHSLLDHKQANLPSQGQLAEQDPARTHLKFEVSLTFGGFPTPGGTTITAARLMMICWLSVAAAAPQTPTCSTTASLADSSHLFEEGNLFDPRLSSTNLVQS